MVQQDVLYKQGQPDCTGSSTVMTEHWNFQELLLGEMYVKRNHSTGGYSLDNTKYEVS